MNITKDMSCLKTILLHTGIQCTVAGWYNARGNFTKFENISLFSISNCTFHQTLHIMTNKGYYKITFSLNIHAMHSKIFFLKTWQNTRCSYRKIRL